MRPPTLSCFLLLPLRRLFFACPPSAPWNLLFFTVESTLFFPCCSSDLPLSRQSEQEPRFRRGRPRQGAALAHLDSLPPHDSVLSTDGSVLFPFGKGCSGVVANYFLYGTEAALSFSAGPVYSSFFR